jgi:D-alanyl-D-alanine carboxypeptidase
VPCLQPFRCSIASRIGNLRFLAAPFIARAENDMLIQCDLTFRGLEMTMPIRKRFTLLFVMFALAMLPIRAIAAPTLLFDITNGKVLYAEEVDRLWYPASLTKIMTAYVVFEAIRNGQISMETKLISTETAAKAPPSKIGLPIGAEISMDLGLRSLIIKSANDVAIMIAEAIGGSEAGFMARMNETAKKLGMSRTHFVNPNGLPIPNQYTTARDLARLSTALMRDFPQHAHYWATPYFQIGNRRLRSHNALLRKFDGADGIKTGFICDSGFNIVASATRDGRKLVAIVLGSPTSQDRNIRAASLLEHGFMTHGWKLYFSPASLSSMPVETTSTEVASIRDQVTGWSCGNRQRSRVSARTNRLRKLRQNRLRRKAAQKSRNAAAANQTPAQIPTLPRPQN